MEEYAHRSTIHGISYIFDSKIPSGDRFLWFLIFTGSCALVGFLISTSFMDWQKDLVITTLKNKARPITDLGFPALTICAAGPHMGLIERALYQNFEKWMEEHGSSRDNTSLNEEFFNYMKEEFQIKERGESILDLLSTMIAPSSESSASSAVMKNQQACAKDQTRKKRNAGNIRTSIIGTLISPDIQIVPMRLLYLQ